MICCFGFETGRSAVVAGLSIGREIGTEDLRPCRHRLSHVSALPRTLRFHCAAVGKLQLIYRLLDLLLRVDVTADIATVASRIWVLLAYQCACLVKEKPDTRRKIRNSDPIQNLQRQYFKVKG